MRGTRPFLIKAKAPLVELLDNDDQFFNYLKKEVVLTVEISDRHGVDFDEILQEIKNSYMISVSKSLPSIEGKFGFDYYWSIEPYDGRVITLGEVLQRAELIDASVKSEALNYLIQTNVAI